MSEERASFGSKLGMILATAGGAVGYVVGTGAIYLRGSIPTDSWVSVEGVTYRL